MMSICPIVFAILLLKNSDQDESIMKISSAAALHATISIWNILKVQLVL